MGLAKSLCAITILLSGALTQMIEADASKTDTASERGETRREEDCCQDDGGPRPSCHPFYRQYSHRFIDIVNNGTELTLHYIHEGERHAPVVVLFYGYPQTITEYRHQIPELIRSGYQVLSFDHRGVADSSPAGEDEAYNSHSVATDVHLALEALGLNQGIHIVGHDFGVPFSYAYANLFADEVKTWVFSSVTPPGPELLLTPALPKPGEFRWWWATFGSGSFEFVFNMVRCREKLWISQILDEVMLPDSRHTINDKEDLEELTRSFSQKKTVRAWGAYYRNLPLDYERNIALGWKKVKMPVLFIADELTGDPGAAEYAENVTVVKLKTGHFIWEEDADAATAMLLDWLNRFEGRKGV